MGAEYLELGSTPIDEPCCQIGIQDSTLNRIECRIYKDMLERWISQHKPDLRDRATMFYLATKAFPHDFGTYREVCAMYDEDDVAGMELAYWLESNTPETWDEEGRRALVSALAEHGYEFTDKGYKLAALDPARSHMGTLGPT